MTLFAAIFFFAGLIPGFMALINIYHAVEARNWVATPATITATELETHRGDDADTYLVTAEYHYQFNGQSYTGERVGFGKGSDNIGSFHEDAHRELSRYQSRQQVFTAWVNPDDPGEAVLYRNIRWLLFAFQMIFMLIFSGAGAGFYYFGKRSLKLENKARELEQKHPEKPWKWRQQWQQNNLKSLSSPSRWFATIFAIFWNLVSSPIWFVLPREVSSGNHIALVAALFPLVGIGMAIWAIRLWRQHWRFGDSELLLSRIPIDRGGLLNANLQLPVKVPGGIELTIRLDCIRKTTERSGNKRSTRENILWQNEQRIIIPDVGGSYRLIPIRFHLPADQPAATALVGKSGIIWRLHISSDIPGVDYEASFELPVFDTGLAADAVAAADSIQFFKAETGIAGDPSRSGVVIQGNQYYFPAARHKSLIFGLFVFSSIFGGSGAGMMIAEHALFGGVFALVGLLVFWGVLSLLLKRSEIRLENGSIVACSGWFRLKERLRLPSFQVNKIWIKSNMSSGNTKYYDLYLDDHNGKKHTLASNLISRRDIEALITHLKNALGIK